jgi:hypothetical protein
MSDSHDLITFGPNANCTLEVSKPWWKETQAESAVRGLWDLGSVEPIAISNRRLN